MSGSNNVGTILLTATTNFKLKFLENGNNVEKNNVSYNNLLHNITQNKLIL